MRKYLPLLVAGLLLSGVAYAQYRSIQMSQDTSNFLAGDIGLRHFHIPSTGAPSPVLSSCGAGTITGNDTAGLYTTGAGTTCTITFATAWPAAPRCIVVPQGNLNYPTYTTSTTAITVTVDVTGTSYVYFCIGA